MSNLPPLPAPKWIAVDTEGADFDVSFVTTEAEAVELLERRDQLDEMTARLYTADQMRAYAIAAISKATGEQA